MREISAITSSLQKKLFVWLIRTIFESDEIKNSVIVSNQYFRYHSGEISRDRSDRSFRAM